MRPVKCLRLDGMFSYLKQYTYTEQNRLQAGPGTGNHSKYRSMCALVDDKRV